MDSTTWIEIDGIHEFRVFGGALIAAVRPHAERGWVAEWDGGTYIGLYRTPAEAKREVAALFTALNGTY